MRILIITQYFPPEMGAPQARLFELASRLIKKGNEVTVLTAMPNYPTGRVFNAYRGLLRVVEYMEGVRVVRTAIYPSKSSRAIPRLLSNFSFILTSILLGGVNLKRFDVTLVESPPLFIAPAGWLISRLKSTQSIFMVSDVWPDILVRMGYVQPGFNLKAMLWLEQWAYRHHDIVALTNPGAMKQLNSRFPNLKTTVISNGVDTTFFHPSFRSEKARNELDAGNNTFLVGYCGLHGLAQGLGAVLDAADLLRDHLNIQFVMIGEGPVKQDLMSEAKARGLNNIRFLCQRPKKEMPSILASCDSLLVPLLVELPGTMPSKIYEALASGAPPIVAKGCEGESLVEQYKAGFTYTPMSGEEMAQAVLDLANNPELHQEMIKRAVKLARRFDRGVLADRTELILRAIVSGKRLPEVVW